MKNKAAPWERIKRKQSRMPAVYREKKQSKHIFMIIGVSLSITLLLSFLRIPERIGMINKPAEQTAIPAVQLTSIYNSLLAEILDMEQEADWDGDGLKNGVDLHPRDIDADRNGISDGYEGKQIINGELPIRYQNIRFVVSHSQSGVVYFRGDYFVSSFAGWMAFSDEAGIPYILISGKWEKAEFERIDDTCYINVPGTCRIRFCEEMPNDRDLIIDAVAARYDNRPDDRYSIANAPLTQLEHIYSSIDNGRTVQISIITDSGEQLLLVHGYDRLGNLIAANCDSLSDAGKISIKVKAQVFWDGQKITMRSWFDFEWGELSSANGDVITVF